MNIPINLLYISQGMNVHRSGTFTAKGRSKEKVVIDWIQEIKKEMDVDEIVKVIFNGDENITEEINKMLEAPLQ